jgi:hypothetical protein
VKGFLLSFGVFMACMVFAFAIFQTSQVANEMLAKQVRYEVEGEKIWRLKYIFERNMEHLEGDLDGWYKVVETYCRLEDLICQIHDPPINITIKGEYVRSNFVKAMR